MTIRPPKSDIPLLHLLVHELLEYGVRQRDGEVFDAVSCFLYHHQLVVPELGELGAQHEVGIDEKVGAAALVQLGEGHASVIGLALGVQLVDDDAEVDLAGDVVQRCKNLEIKRATKVLNS